MRTLEELYNEVIASDELKQEFIEAFKTKESTEAVLKKYDCDVSFEDFQTFLKEKEENQEILSETEIKEIAGGDKYSGLKYALISVTTAYIGCAITTEVSLIKNFDGPDSQIPSDMLCV